MTAVYDSREGPTAVSGAARHRDEWHMAGFVPAAVQGLRPVQMRRLRLDDVDLADRTLTLGEQTRRSARSPSTPSTGWLRMRRWRWPTCGNPHLLVSQQTAVETGPVSDGWVKLRFRGLGATLERLRVDRQLEELLVHVPGPLHFAAVSGVTSSTGMRSAAVLERELGLTTDEGPDDGPAT